MNADRFPGVSVQEKVDVWHLRISSQYCAENAGFRCYDAQATLVFARQHRRFLRRRVSYHQCDRCRRLKVIELSRQACHFALVTFRNRALMMFLKHLPVRGVLLDLERPSRVLYLFPHLERHEYSNKNWAFPLRWWKHRADVELRHFYPITGHADNHFSQRGD